MLGTPQADLPHRGRYLPPPHRSASSRPTFLTWPPSQQASFAFPPLPLPHSPASPANCRLTRWCSVAGGFRVVDPTTQRSAISRRPILTFCDRRCKKMVLCQFLRICGSVDCFHSFIYDSPGYAGWWCSLRWNWCIMYIGVHFIVLFYVEII